MIRAGSYILRILIVVYEALLILYWHLHSQLLHPNGFLVGQLEPGAAQKIPEERFPENCREFSEYSKLELLIRTLPFVGDHKESNDNNGCILHESIHIVS